MFAFFETYLAVLQAWFLHHLIPLLQHMFSDEHLFWQLPVHTPDFVEEPLLSQFPTVISLAGFHSWTARKQIVSENWQQWSSEKMHVTEIF